MAWDELRRREWAGPHDLIAHLVVLAARNSDADALNLGAQAIRREAGELRPEHTYALPGGDTLTLTLAVGDIVRVRENDYRARCGEGSDMLNGYRVVITAVDEQHRVEITWRVKDPAGPGGYREVSGWIAPQKITGGVLSLGYVMTIAASQGMTCTTSLTYGHGASAYAAYPAITRARRENHLWLPLAVIQDEQTRARLGAARSEKELLERAVEAFARFLGQSRPDRMVSDLLREPSAPAPQRDLAAEQARAASRRNLDHARTARAARAKSRGLSHHQAQDEDRLREQTRLAGEKAARLLDRIRAGAAERAVPSWTSRLYGDLSPRELDRRIAEGDRLADDADREAATAATAARELAARLDQERASRRPTRGQRFAADAAQVLDRAQAHLATARGHEADAFTATRHAEDRGRQLARLAASEDKSRLALRLAGTSRREQRELTDRLTGERAAYLVLADDARRNARQALQEAWQTVQDSAVAQRLGVTGQTAPESADQAAERLTELRAAAARHGHSMDKRDHEYIGRTARRAAEHREHAAHLRTQAANAAPRKPCAPRSLRTSPSSTTAR